MKKITLILLMTISIFGQTNDPYKILEKVKDKFNGINDYSADVSIKLDVSFIQMPDRKAKVYFKKPDKFRIKSDGFAMLPKQGMNFSPVIFLSDDFDALNVKTDTLDGTNVEIIKIIPRSDSSQIILSTLWIDTKNNVIKKVEASTSDAGNFEIQFYYSKELKFGLPDEMRFSFNMKNLRLPNMSPKNHDDKKQMFEGKSAEGKVIIKYSGYEVNKGIDDKIFEQDEK